MYAMSCVVGAAMTPTPPRDIADKLFAAFWIILGVMFGLYVLIGMAIVIYQTLVRIWTTT